MIIKCELLRDQGPNGTIKIAVEDNGVGIKEEDKGKLFKLFGFLDSTKEINTKGIGLGLFICKKIVNIFGGDVSVESEVDKGSCFSFTFELERRASDMVTVQRILNPRPYSHNSKIVVQPAFNMDPREVSVASCNIELKRALSR